MLAENKYFIITFESNYLVLKAEKELKKNNVKPEFIPVPRDISSACGICIKFNDKIEFLSNISYENLWQVIEEKIENSKRKKYIYQKIGEENE